MTTWNRLAAWRRRTYEILEHGPIGDRPMRLATVTATSRTNLLVLDASDFHMLMERDKRIADRVHEVVRERVGLEAVSPKGDITAGELSAATEER
jgi:voltage-gated potassium channel